MRWARINKGEDIYNRGGGGGGGENKIGTAVERYTTRPLGCERKNSPRFASFRFVSPNLVVSGDCVTAIHVRIHPRMLCNFFHCNTTADTHSQQLFDKVLSKR